MAPGTFLPVPRVRLDSLLAERGLFESRTRAAAAVIAGQVHLGPGPPAGREAGAARRRGGRARRRRPAAVRLARRRSSSPTRSTPSGLRSPGAKRSMPALLRAASPTACCSTAPLGSMPSTLATACSTTACDTTLVLSSWSASTPASWSRCRRPATYWSWMCPSSASRRCYPRSVARCSRAPGS